MVTWVRTCQNSILKVIKKRTDSFVLIWGQEMTDRMGYQKAAGIKAKKRDPGRPAGDRPKKGELRRLYVKEGRSIREIAEILGCSKDKIYRTLEAYEINRRAKTRRSRLEQYSLEHIRDKIKKEGMGVAAGRLGVSRQFLRRYLRDRETIKKN